MKFTTPEADQQATRTAGANAAVASVRRTLQSARSQKHSTLGVQLVVLLNLLPASAAFAACGYVGQAPACPYCTAEPIVIPTSTALLHASIKWCGIGQAPCVADPTRACQVAGDYKTMMWRRHERASDCIWIPQCQITLRSGGIINVQQFKVFNDLDTSIGVSGDIVVSDTMGNPLTTELDNTFTTCDMAWNTPTPQPKGVIAISAFHLIDTAGNSVARGISYVGSITRPWMAFADPTTLCQLNERSVAHEFGHVLSLGHVTTSGDLMVTGGTGATLTTAQCDSARTYLQNNTILDPPDQTNVNLVGFMFGTTNDAMAEANYLQIKKVVATDNSPNQGDLSFCIGTDGLVPTLGTNETVKYWILLDTDNNPATGGNPTNFVPGRPISGVEFVCLITLAGSNVTAALYEPGDFGFFVPVLLSPGSLTAARRDINLVICDPTTNYTGPSVIPRFSEIDYKIANSALIQSGISTGGIGGLFPNGLRIQAVGTTPATTNFSMTPEHGGVIRLPQILFPTISIPPNVAPGQLVQASVARMTPNARLEFMLGDLNIPLPTITDPSGAATFQFNVPTRLAGGPRLATVGIDDPADATTADTVVNVVIRPPLSIVTAGTNVVVSWPSSQYMFRLLVSSGLSPSSWVPVPQPPVLAGGIYSVTLRGSQPTQFYQLIYP